MHTCTFFLILCARIFSVPHIKVTAKIIRYGLFKASDQKIVLPSFSYICQIHVMAEIIIIIELLKHLDIYKQYNNNNNNNGNNNNMFYFYFWVQRACKITINRGKSLQETFNLLTSPYI